MSILSNLYKSLFKKYDRNGFEESGIHKNGTLYDDLGYDVKGYDVKGYNKFGFNKNGIDRNGYNKNGYDIDGYDKYGYNINGYNKFGYDKNGYNKNGYDKNGYNMLGFNKSGRDKDGFFRDGITEIYDSKGCLINTKLMRISYSEKRKSEIEESFNRGKSKGKLINNRKIVDGNKTNWGYYAESGLFPSRGEASKIVHIITSGSKAYCIRKSVYCSDYQKNYNFSHNEFQSLKGLPCFSCLDSLTINAINDWY